ncbi:MAG: DUF3147 family protein [Alkaliphilus sp.]
MQFFIKVIVTAIIVAIVSYVSRKFPTIGAIVVSLPLTSMLAIMWLYRDTNDIAKVIELSQAIIWIVVPSIVFFIALVLLLKNDVKFYLAMFLSSVIMILGYNAYIFILRKFGVNI